MGYFVIRLHNQRSMEINNIIFPKSVKHNYILIFSFYIQTIQILMIIMLTVSLSLNMIFQNKL